MNRRKILIFERRRRISRTSTAPNGAARSGRDSFPRPKTFTGFVRETLTSVIKWVRVYETRVRLAAVFSSLFVESKYDSHNSSQSYRVTRRALSSYRVIRYRLRHRKSVDSRASFGKCRLRGDRRGDLFLPRSSTRSQSDAAAKSIRRIRHLISILILIAM